MSNHSAPDEVLDLGERYFMAGIFVPLGLSFVLTWVGAGLTGDWLVLCMGLFNMAALMYVSQKLYAVEAMGRSFLRLWATVFFLMAVAFVLANPVSPTTLFRVLQGLIPTLASALIFSPRCTRAFLASKAGQPYEHLVPTPEMEAAEFFTIDQATGKPVLTATAQAAVGSLSFAACVAVSLLVLVAVGSLYFVFFEGKSWALVLVALICLPMSMMLIAARADLGYLKGAAGHEAAHLGNLANCLRDLGRIVTFALVLFGLIFLFGVVF